MATEKKKKKKFKKRYVIIPAVIVAVIVAFSFMFQVPETALFEQEEAKTGSITTYYSFSGNVAPHDKKSLTADGNIKVKELLVEEGDTVSVGDVLYTVDNTDYDANIRQAEASLEMAQVNYDNAQNGQNQQSILQAESTMNAAKLSMDNAEKTLNDTKALYEAEIVAKSDLDQAQSAYGAAKQQYDTAKSTYELTKGTLADNTVESAEAQLKQAQAAYDAAVSQRVDDQVTADFAGEITKIYIEEGGSVMLGSPTMDISDYGQMIATIKVDEYDVSALEIGKEVICTVDALGKDLTGTVTKISRQATETNGISYFTADVALPQDDLLLEGMSVEVKALNQNAENVVTISMRALQFDNENQPFVYYADEKGNIQQKPVTVGINDGTTVEIKEGVSAGDIILYPKQTFNVADMMG